MAAACALPAQLRNMRSDVELMLKAREGSTVAFDWLVKRHHRAVVQYFHWRLWDRSLAEDFAQDVFLKLFQALPNYVPRGQGQFRSYLFSIAANHLKDHIRRVKARPRLVSLSNPRNEDDDDNLLERLTAVESPPDAGLERDETEQRLCEALTDLPEDQYLVFSMHKHVGMKYEEIAVDLGIKTGTVKSRISAAYQHLRRAVYSADGEEEDQQSGSPAEETGSRSSASGSRRRRAKSGRSRRNNNRRPGSARTVTKSTCAGSISPAPSGSGRDHAIEEVAPEAGTQVDAS